MAKNLKVVLLGYMASGKSTIGKSLSQKLGVSFLDLDNEIEKNVEMTVPEIFEKKGELFFRKKEAEVLQRLLAEREEGFVLALGGGTPCYGKNMEIVNSNTQNTFYIKLTVVDLVERIVNEKQQRPLVANIADEDLMEFVGKHLFERNPFYAKASHIIDSRKASVDEVVKQIEGLLV